MSEQEKLIRDEMNGIEKYLNESEKENTNEHENENRQYRFRYNDLSIRLAAMREQKQPPQPIPIPPEILTAMQPRRAFNALEWAVEQIASLADQLRQCEAALNEARKTNDILSQKPKENPACANVEEIP